MRDLEITSQIPREELLPLLAVTRPATERITAEIPAQQLDQLLAPEAPPIEAPWWYGHRPTVVFASAAIALGIGFGLIAALG